MEYDAFCKAFGVDPRHALLKARKGGNARPSVVKIYGEREVAPLAETKRERLPAGGFTRGADTQRMQSTIFTSHDAPTHVHRGRRMRGILECVRKYLEVRASLPTDLAAILSVDVPNGHVPCDGEHLVRLAAPGGGYPTFPHLPGVYGTMIPHLMRAISSLHTMFGLTSKTIEATVLIERIDKTLARLRNDPREA